VPYLTLRVAQVRLAVHVRTADPDAAPEAH